VTGDPLDLPFASNRMQALWQGLLDAVAMTSIP